MKQDFSFVVTEFANPSGQIVFRVSGHLNGKRVRKNFPSRSEAETERKVLEIQALQAETGIRTAATRLTDEELHMAEAAIARLKDAPRSLLFYLDYALANYREPRKQKLLSEAITEYVAIKTREHVRTLLSITYVATQAAVSAHNYDPSLTGKDLLSFGPFNVNLSTPNIYNGWLASNGAAVGARINFYNINDMALGLWNTDQVLKPDWRLWKYYYASKNLTTVQDLFKKKPLGVPRRVYTPIDLHLGDAQNVRDRYEIMAYAAESRSHALGAVPSVAGLVPQNLWNVWPKPDPFAVDDQPQHQYAKHPWHSAQFRFTNMEQKNYWHALLDQYGLLP